MLNNSRWKRIFLPNFAYSEFLFFLYISHVNYYSHNNYKMLIIISFLIARKCVVCKKIKTTNEATYGVIDIDKNVKKCTSSR